jgi:hypothetical protein
LHVLITHESCQSHVIVNTTHKRQALRGDCSWQLK